jgi:hypothetical protein
MYVSRFFRLFQKRSVLALGGTVTLVSLLVVVGFVGITMEAHPRKTVVHKVSFDGMQLDIPMQDSAASHPIAPSAEPLRLSSKVVRKASLHLEIKDFSDFEVRMKTVVARYGYLSEWKVSLDDLGQHRVELVLRVLPQHLDDVLKVMRGLGKLLKEHISVEDVSRTYADLDARLTNQKAAADRMRDLIRSRTGKLSEVVEAEQALTQITESIERMLAEKRVMDHEIAYSTIHAEVNTPTRAAPPASDPGFFTSMREAFIVGWQQAVAAARVVFQIGAWLLPWCVLLLPGAGIWWWRKRRTTKV